MDNKVTVSIQESGTNITIQLVRIRPPQGHCLIYSTDQFFMDSTLIILEWSDVLVTHI